MLPKTHFIFGGIFALIVFLLLPQIGYIGFIIIWFSSFLIDVDHYLFYVFLKKDISLKNSYHWFVKKHRKFKELSINERKERIKERCPIPVIFHGIEFILLLIILSFFSKIFVYILIGVVFHQLLDFISITHDRSDIRHIGSQTYNFIQYKKRLKRNHLNLPYLK
ncbi:MAG: hypothetical protein WC533_03905 [Candidatus Pacearchaeota archaeon]